METPLYSVLLIEDDEDDFILTRDVLERVDGVSYHLDWVVNLTTAAAALSSSCYDAILVDYDLGLETGLDFLAWAQAHDLTTPILFLSAHGARELDLRAMSAGAVDYLNKHTLTPALLERALRYARERAAHLADLERRVLERTHELQQANDLLETVFSSIHLQVAYLDRELRFLRVNPRYAARVGMDPAELIGRGHFELFPSPAYEAIFRRVLASGQPYYAYAREFYSLAAPTVPTYWDWSLEPVRRDGEIYGLILSLVDVTQQTRLAQAEAQQAVRLQASIALFESLFEAVPDAIIVIDQLGLIRRLNRRALTWFGYPAEALLGRPLELLLPEAAVPPLSSDSPPSLPQFQLARSQDGRILPVEVNLAPLEWEETPHIVCSLHDLTSRQRLEAELQEIQRRLLEAAELERLRLAQDLHDGPMQDLYGAIFQLRALEEEAGALQPRLAAAGAALNEVQKTLRTITRELRPPTLDPFGLQKTIASHAETFQRANPELRLELDLQPDGQLLPERVRLALFRIYQQALANTVRHAQANSVQVRFLWEPNEAVLEVRDDGVGFEVPDRWLDLVRHGHLGLAGIAERAQAIDGRLLVRSAPGNGTQIQVRVPLHLLE
jgi:PAS domain S-box-containing protein